MSKYTFKGFFKEHKSENYVLLIIGIIGTVLGVLMLAGIITVQSDGEISDDKRVIIGAIFSVLSLASLISAIISIRKDNHFKKNSVLNEIKNDYEKQVIKNKLEVYGLDVSKIKVDKDDELDSISIKYFYKEGFFLCDVSLKEVSISYDYDEEYYDAHDNEEDYILEDLFIEFSSITTSSEVYKKFSNAVLSNM